MLRNPRNATVHNGSETSKAARDKAKVAVKGQRLQVLNYIRKQGESGATDTEIQAALNMRGDTERPRRRELEQAGLITESIHRRNGCKIWLYVEPIEGESNLTKPTGPTLDAAQQERERQKQRRRQVEADREETACLEAQHGERLDSMAAAELQNLFDAEPDPKNRDALKARTERLGRDNSFVRRRLLTLLEQQTNSDCRR